MDGKMGSYLLQELAIWVCSQVGERSFPHDVWVMAVVSEPATFGGHQSSTVLYLIRRPISPSSASGLVLPRPPRRARASRGDRILTLAWASPTSSTARPKSVAKRQAEGPPAEGFRGDDVRCSTSYLDTKVVDLPSKPVPWSRFEESLKARGWNDPAAAARLGEGSKRTGKNGPIPARGGSQPTMAKAKVRIGIIGRRAR